MNNYNHFIVIEWTNSYFYILDSDNAPPLSMYYDTLPHKTATAATIADIIGIRITVNFIVNSYEEVICPLEVEKHESWAIRYIIIPADILSKKL